MLLVWPESWSGYLKADFMSPKRIFFSIFQLSTFFSTHLILEALLITWGRLQDNSEHIPVFEAQYWDHPRLSRSSYILFGAFHQQLKNSELFWGWLCRGLPVLPLVNDLKLSTMFVFSLHTFESVLQKFCRFFCLRWASLFNLCQRLITQ